MQETYCMHTLSTSTVTSAASAAPAATPAAMQQYETVAQIVRSSKDSICSTKRVHLAAREPSSHPLALPPLPRFFEFVYLHLKIRLSHSLDIIM